MRVALLSLLLLPCLACADTGLDSPLTQAMQLKLLIFPVAVLVITALIILWDRRRRH